LVHVVLGEMQVTKILLQFKRGIPAKKFTFAPLNLII
jgi:hypothetical protein